MGPPLAQGIRWCTSQTAGGWVQPGNWQCLSRWMTAVRRCGGMVRVVRPRSRGWLGVLNGAPSRVPRRWLASPPGPDSRSRLQRRIVACSRCRVASRQPDIAQSWPSAAAGLGGARGAAGAGERDGARAGARAVAGVGGALVPSRLSRPAVRLAVPRPVRGGLPAARPRGLPAGFPAARPRGLPADRRRGLPRPGAWPFLAGAAAGWRSSSRAAGGGRGRGVGQPHGGQLVQRGPVDLPGDHRGQDRVAGGGLGGGAGQVHRSGPGRGHRRGPGPFQGGAAAQVVQVDVHGQVRRAGRPGRGSAARRSAAGTPPRSRHAGAAPGCGYLPAPPSAPKRPAPPSARPRRRGSGHPAAARRRRTWSPATARVPRTRRRRCRGWSGRVRAFPGPAAPGHADPRRPAPPPARSVRVRPQIFGELIGPVADQPGQRDRKLPGRQRGRDRPGGRPAAAPTRSRPRPRPG